MQEKSRQSNLILEELYQKHNIPEEDRVLPKNIVFLVKDREVDLSHVLRRFGLSKYEVCVTWVKHDLSMAQELRAIEPKLIIQIDHRFTDKLPLISSDGDYDQDLIDRVHSVIADSFVGLHHHDEFSLKDGLGTVEQLIGLLKAQKRSFCCVTNHGSVGGWIRQYNACKKAGIKPLFGCEAYYSPYRGDDPEEKKKYRSANHLLLLAKTAIGANNIIKIHNDAQLNGFYYTPRVDRDAIEKWGSGIISSTTCMAGYIPRALMNNEWDKAREWWNFCKQSFDEYYVELQVIEFETQRDLNRRLIKFAREVGGELILTADSHYLFPEHTEAHDLMMYMRQGKTIVDATESEDTVWDFDVRNLHYRNAGEMREVFDNGFTDKRGDEFPPLKDDLFTEEIFNKAMAKTREIAISVDTIDLSHPPTLPKLYDDGDTIFKRKINEGVHRLGIGEYDNKDEYIDRLHHEYKLITKLGWTDYFLVVERIISEAKKRYGHITGDYTVGHGRGSAAGSLVSWCLGITDCDPIKYGLLFERFISEDRGDCPDIDLDFHSVVKDNIKDIIVDLFGEEKVCSIGTYSKYKTKAVILDVARVLALDVKEANRVTKQLESLTSFEAGGVEDIVDNLPFSEICKHYGDLKKYFEENPEVEEYADIFRNQIRNMSMHAGGVIISDNPLTDKIPILRDKSGNIISAWAESGSTAELSTVGLVKFDLLGLRNLDVMADCIKLVEETRGIKLNKSKIPVDSRDAIEKESKHDFVGIFQLENPSTKPVVDQIGVTSLNDIAAVTSLIRPGPRDMGMDMEYGRRKNGESYNAPEILRELLADTHGVLVYQEQAMKIARELSGFSGIEANQLRKACGKKNPELMAKMGKRFIDGAKPKIDSGEITKNEVEDTWELISKFAGYAFNASHAYCYSMLSTAEMWMKNRYPIEFITSLLNNNKIGTKIYGQDAMKMYINYARKRHIKAIKPDINKSKVRFTINDGAIIYSLKHIKNVGTSAENIVRVAEDKPFESMEDFYERCVYEVVTQSGVNKGKKRKTRPNKKVIDSLVFSGAFDELWKMETGIEQIDRVSILRSFYDLRGKREVVKEYTTKQIEEREVESLGICLSKDPIRLKLLETVEKNNIVRSNEKWSIISKRSDRKRVFVVGRISSIMAFTSRKGNPMFIVELTDDIDVIKFFVFNAARLKFKNEAKTDQVVAVPLDRFDEGMSFFDDNKSCIVLK